MDMYNHRGAIHKALTKLTEFDMKPIGGFKETGCAGLVWDYLWGSYSCLGDKEYEEFEGNDKYALKLNAHTLPLAGKPVIEPRLKVLSTF